jgi:hypothetical protein
LKEQQHLWEISKNPIEWPTANWQKLVAISKTKRNVAGAALFYPSKTFNR